MGKASSPSKLVGSTVVLLLLLFDYSPRISGQSPTPTPADQRGIGIESDTSKKSSQTSQQAREAKPELVLQSGYNSLFGATRMVFSPDERLLATTTFHSSTIKLWEVATGRELRDLSTGSQSAAGVSPPVSFSRDSRLLAAAAGDNSVKIWDVTSGRELQTLAGTQGTIASSFGVYFLAFGAGNQLITVSDAIRVWDVTTGQQLRSFETSSFAPSSFNGADGGFALTPDGSQLVLMVEDPKSELHFVDLASGQNTRSIDLPDRQLESPQIAFAPDGHVVVAAVNNKKLKFWSGANKSSEHDLGPTTRDFSFIKFSRDGRFLALSENYVINIWDTATAKQVTTIKVPNGGLLQGQVGAFLGFSENGRRIATGGFDTQTIIWESESGKRTATLNGRTNMANNVMFSADGNQLSSGGRTRWDLRTGRGLRLLTAPTDNGIGVASPDGRYLALSKPNGMLQTVFDLQNGHEIAKLSLPGNGSVRKTRFSNDGSLLVTVYGPSAEAQPALGSTTYDAKVWDVKSGRQLQSFATGDSAFEAAFSNDSRTVATIGSMGQLTLWDVGSGAKIRDLATSPMANITSMQNTMPNLRNLKRGQIPPITQMPNMADISAMVTNVLGSAAAGTNGRNVTSLAFSPDGKVLATGGVETKSNLDLNAMMNQAMNPSNRKNKKSQPTPDPNNIMKDLRVTSTGQVVLWDIATGQQISAIKGHGKAVSQIAFNRDGKVLATAGSDNSIKTWESSTGRELRTFLGHTATIDSIDFSPDGRLMASAAEDGSTFLWDLRTGEHLLTLISLDDGDEWMVVTPEGLFDGTPVSWNQILWRYNQDTFNVAPIEWFFNEYYYPGLLSDVFYGKRPHVAQDISKKDRRQPIVKLTLGGVSTPNVALSMRTVKVKLEVSDAPPDQFSSQGSGAIDLRLFRNGSLLKVWHGDVLKGQSSVSLEQEITITAGENRLVAYAFNKDNVKSKDAPLVLTGADNLKRKGVAYIVAVGVNEYENSQYNLKYAVADAQSFADEVRQRQSQLATFDRVEVVTLLNEKATKANVLAALKRLGNTPTAPTLKATAIDSIKHVEPEDTVIIYFAGHGTAQQQRFYLIPHDLGYTGDRTKLDERGLKAILEHSISDLDLEDAVEGLDAGHLVMVIDACNSGQALEAEEKRRGPMNSKGLAQLAYEKGMYILTAAQSFQAALEAAQLGHGLLTYALIEEGLKTAAADNEPKDGLVSAREWLDYATERVPQMQQEKMQQGRGIGLAFVEDEAGKGEPDKKSVQRPRVFYRRELEANPLVVAKP